MPDQPKNPATNEDLVRKVTDRVLQLLKEQMRRENERRGIQERKQ